MTRPLAPRRRQILDALHGRDLNFDVTELDRAGGTDGWHVDDYCAPLLPEPPGPPVAGGPWEVTCRLMRDYEFADPRIVRAIHHSGAPLEDRTILLEARFYGLTFRLGVRVGGVTDRATTVEGRPVRIWGWNYRTLQGHLEMGQMDYEAWKWLDSGAVEFRIHVVSRAARIPNPLVRLGFRLFGRRMQRKFARRALERMSLLVDDEITHPDGLSANGRPEAMLDSVTVEPAATDRRIEEQLHRRQRLRRWRR